MIIKEVKRYRDDAGNTFAKANADLDMAVDALLQSDTLDRVVLATGDGDFVRVVQTLQNKGCRVEVIAFDNVSAELRREADYFMSGYLVPHLLPAREGPSSPAWGEKGSIVRGACYHWNRDGGFGFIRYLKALDGNLWVTDTRREESPYASAYFSFADLEEGFPVELLHRPETVLEFRLGESQAKEGEMQAYEVTLATGNDRGRGGPPRPGRGPRQARGPRDDAAARARESNGNFDLPEQEPDEVNGNVDIPEPEAETDEVNGNVDR